MHKMLSVSVACQRTSRWFSIVFTPRNMLRTSKCWTLPDQDLYHDATRDLRALGCHIGIINNCQTLDRETRVSGLAKDCQEGVLFMCALLMSS